MPFVTAVLLFIKEKESRTKNDAGTRQKLHKHKGGDVTIFRNGTQTACYSSFSVSSITTRVSNHVLLRGEIMGRTLCELSRN